MAVVTFGPNVWNPARAFLCTCGWGGRRPTLRAANAAVAEHLADACEGCDHAVDVWVTGTRTAGAAS